MADPTTLFITIHRRVAAMRWVLTAGFVFLALPVTAAQPVTFEDPAGDATIRGTVPMQGLDLLGGEISLAGGNLTVLLRLDNAAFMQDAAAPSVFGGWEYWVELAYRADVFHIVMEPGLGAFPDDSNPGTTIDTSVAHLYRRDEARSPPWLKLYEGSASIDREASTIAADLALDSLVAVDGFHPGPGEPVQVMSAASFFDEGLGSPHDFPRDGAIIPLGTLSGGDSAALPADAFVALPIQGTLGLSLSTPQPVRFSNGEATTYHWPISVTNRLDERIEAVVSVEGSDDLTLRSPELLLLEAGEERVMDVFATAPFQHDHGGQRSLTVTVTAGGQSSAMDLTIQYLDVAQPAGHHPTVFLHTKNIGGGSYGSVWMDTLPETDRPHDARMELRPTACLEDGEPRDGQGLFHALEPGLLIGVDARMDETAHLTGSMEVPAFGGGVLAARLVVYDPVSYNPDRQVIDELAVQVPVGPIAQATTIPLDLDLPLPPELDLLPPTSGLNLALQVGLCAEQTLGTVAVPHEALTPFIPHGASLTLPLDEYHDVLPVEADHGVVLTVAEPRRRGAPGTTILWEVTVQGDASGYDAELFGVAAADAVLHARHPGAGEVIPVSLVVPDARDGDVLELILAVSAVDDPTRSAVLRLTAIVDSSHEGDDQARLAGLEDGRATPFAVPGLLVLALLAAAMARRRP